MVSKDYFCYTTGSSSCCTYYVCMDACMAHKNRGIWRHASFPRKLFALRCSEITSEATLKPLWGHSEASLRPHWGYTEATLRAHWGHFDGAILGPFWGHSGAKWIPDKGGYRWFNNEYFTTAQVQQSCVQKPQVCSVDSFPAVNAA